jgi:hypothetical protein
MVSIVIISILSSVTLYAMASVQTLAQEQRTKSQLARIHDLLLSQLESYEGRVPRRTTNAALPAGANGPQQERVCALRETMRMEMPDRVTDVLLFQPGANSPSIQSNQASPAVPVCLLEPPAITRYFTNFVNSHVNWNNGGWTAEHQGAECLFMILSRTEVGERSALEFFNETEIGDTDGDGMPEILDAWAQPVRFVRWPVGLTLGTPYVDTNSLDPFDPGRVFAGMLEAGGPIGPMGVVQNGISHLVVPLVVSAGKDRVFDLALANENGRVFYANSTIPNDPWMMIGGPGDWKLMGATDSDGDGNGENNAVDNIYSHIIETSVN